MEAASSLPAENFLSESEFINSKAFLLTSSTKSGLNLYDHLAKVITRILDERPDNSVDLFEDVSADVKKTKFTAEGDTLIDRADRTGEVALAEIHHKLFVKPGDDVEGAPSTLPPPSSLADEPPETPLPNLLELSYYFEQASVGLGREELFRIWLALKQLLDSYPLQSIRFWGKILGIEQNYYVAECEWREGEEPEEEAPEEEQSAEESAAGGKDSSFGGLGSEGGEPGEEGEPEPDPIPQPIFKPAPVTPKEERGQGCNKKVYFACNEPGKGWVRLPGVTPAQIVVSRKIRKFFTGRLNAPVSSFPPFPGTEANFLRAQIARISAGTIVSPLGLFMFDEEEEDPEEGGRTTFIENEEFTGTTLGELLDPMLSSWVHHVQYVLPQGRTLWWNPKQKGEEEEEEEEEEEKEEPDEVEPESGPPLLTPLSEDQPIENQPAWTLSVSTRRVPQYAVAVIHSNLWPGAHSFVAPNKKLFENVYVGLGTKYAAENHTPAPPPQVMEEFPSGPEITEIDDPSVEEETAFKAAQAKAEEGEEEGGEEGAEEGGEGDPDEGED